MSEIYTKSVCFVRNLYHNPNLCSVTYSQSTKEELKSQNIRNKPEAQHQHTEVDRVKYRSAT